MNRTAWGIVRVTMRIIIVGLWVAFFGYVFAAMGCGGVTAVEVDASDLGASDAVAAEQSEAMPGVKDDGGSLSGAGPEVLAPIDAHPPSDTGALSIPPCNVKGVDRVRKTCRPGCAEGCVGGGMLLPQNGVACEAPGLPVYNGALTCVGDCNDCP